MSKYKKAILFLIIANIIWGATPPLVKWSLPDIPLFTFLFLRFAIPTLFFFFIFRKKLAIRPKPLIGITLATLVGTSFSIFLFFLAMTKTASINASIIASSTPIFLMFGAYLTLRERFRHKVFVGNIIGFLGIFAIVIQPVLMHQSIGSVIGNLLLIASTLTGIMGTLLIKKVIKDCTLESLTFWTFFITTISFLPFFYSDLTLYGFLPHLTFKGIIGLVFCIVFASALAYYLSFWALKILPASEVGLFTYIDPVVTLLIAAPLLGEYPSSLFLAGSGLVFIGIFIAENRVHYHPFHKLFT